MGLPRCRRRRRWQLIRRRGRPWLGQVQNPPRGPQAEARPRPHWTNLREKRSRNIWILIAPLCPVLSYMVRCLDRIQPSRLPGGGAGGGGGGGAWCWVGWCCAWWWWITTIELLVAVMLRNFDDRIYKVDHLLRRFTLLTSPLHAQRRRSKTGGTATLMIDSSLVKCHMHESTTSLHLIKRELDG